VRFTHTPEEIDMSKLDRLFLVIRTCWAELIGLGFLIFAFLIIDILLSIHGR